MVHSMYPNAPKNRTRLAKIMDTTDYGLDSSGRAKSGPEILYGPTISDRDIVLSAGVKARDTARAARAAEQRATDLFNMPDQSYLLRESLVDEPYIHGDRIFFSKPVKGRSQAIPLSTADRIGRPYALHTKEYPLHDLEDVFPSTRAYNTRIRQMLSMAEHTDRKAREASSQFINAKYDRLGIPPKQKYGPYKTE